MKKENEKRIRPNISEPNVGNSRYERYKAAISRYNESLEKGFYIESISLMESLMCDRLESLSNEFAQSPKYSYENLGTFTKPSGNAHQILIKAYPFMEDLLAKLDKWRDCRNHTVHELAKLDANLSVTFEQDYNNLQAVAIDGNKLFRELDNTISNIRKN